MPRKSMLAALPLAASLLASAALADTHIKLSPDSGHPGLTVNLTGRGFGASEPVDLYFDGTDVGTGTTLGNGNLRAQLTVPANAAPGRHRVKVVGRTDGLSARHKFIVQTDWPQTGFVAEGTRDNIYENVLSAANVSSLAQAWTVDLGANSVSSPVVAGGVLYVTGSDQKLHAFDPATGAALWTISTGSSLNAAPVVANGVIYVVASDGNLYAYQVPTGTLLWTATGVSALASPTVANGVVYVGSQNSAVFAFDAVTGATLWSVATRGQIAAVSPAVANGVVYIGASFEDFDVEGTYYALDAATGATLWTVTSEEFNDLSAGVANGVVYVGGDRHAFYAFNAATGAVQWTAETGKVATAPAIADGVVYTGSEYRGLTRALDAFDATTGAQLWSVPLAKNVTVSAPAAANGVVYAGATDGNVYAFDAATGAKLWSAATGAFVSGVVVTDGMVFATSGNSTVYAFALNGGGAKTRKP